MRKFTFNLDVVVVVIFLFVICIFANIYQRKIHLDLHHKNLEAVSMLTATKLELIKVKAALSKYELVK